MTYWLLSIMPDMGILTLGETQHPGEMNRLHFRRDYLQDNVSPGEVSSTIPQQK
jgi:hypothetical protein